MKPVWLKLFSFIMLKGSSWYTQNSQDGGASSTLGPYVVGKLSVYHLFQHDQSKERLKYFLKLWISHVLYSYKLPIQSSQWVGVRSDFPDLVLENIRSYSSLAKAMITRHYAARLENLLSKPYPWIRHFLALVFTLFCFCSVHRRLACTACCCHFLTGYRSSVVMYEM